MTVRTTARAGACRPARRRLLRGGAPALLGLLCALATALPLRAEPRPAPSAAGRPGAARAVPAAAAASAVAPAVQLWVEWREVGETVQEESAGGREASVATTTEPSAVQAGTWSTARASDPSPSTRLRLANGGSARVAWTRPGPVAWVSEVWVDAVPGRRPDGSAAWTAHPGLVARPAPDAQPRSLQLAVRWPGGSAPVAVDLRLDDPAAADGRPRSLEGSTLVPLDHWTTVAHLGGDAADGTAAARGTVGTRRAEPARLLQLRVRLGAALPGAASVPVRGR